jgi:hypothetical protein
MSVRYTPRAGAPIAPDRNPPVDTASRGGQDAMSQERPENPALAPRRRISVSLAQVRRAPVLNVIGLPE